MCFDNLNLNNPDPKNCLHNNSLLQQYISVSQVLIAKDLEKSSFKAL